MTSVKENIILPMLHIGELFHFYLVLYKLCILLMDIIYNLSINESEWINIGDESTTSCNVQEFNQIAVYTYIAKSRILKNNAVYK